MARKCSSCGNNGHNSRTCSGSGGHQHQHRMMSSVETGGVRLFGVQLHVPPAGVGSSSSSSPRTTTTPMKKCFSMECLSSSSASPAYYAAALAAAAAPSSSPSSASSSSSLVDEAAAEKVTNNGYLSDGLMGRAAQERKKGVPWTEDEHRRFLAGLEKLGKGDWRGISRHFVTTRTPTQVASHAQKYFLRQSSLTQKKRRSSLFDVVENSEKATRQRDDTMNSMSETEFPALSLGISSSGGGGSGRLPKPAEHHHPLPPGPPRSLALSPRCSAAMMTISGASPTNNVAAPRHHPSLVMSKPRDPSLSLLHHHHHQAPPPDLELKISTARQTAADQAAGPAPRTPFFGTIRVT